MMAEHEHPVWVLGGGGIAGIAWEVGLLAGLADEGILVSQDAVVIGTSAGSVVGAQVCSGMALPELLERQLGPVPFEGVTSFAFSSILRLARAQLFARSAEQAAQRIGRMALAAATRDPAEFRANIEARLPSHEWPAADLRVVAVDAESGRHRVFTRADAVGLVEVVGASCAVPLASPPVAIEGHRYMDGGMRSTLNLDLAPGRGPVIALAPSIASIGPWASIRKQRAILGAERTVAIITRDSASRAAGGSNVMDRSVVPALAAAAREQGRREAAGVTAALQSRD